MTEARNVSFAHIYSACVPERLLFRLEHARKRVPTSLLEIHHRIILFQPYPSLPSAYIRPYSPQPPCRAARISNNWALHIILYNTVNRRLVCVTVMQEESSSEHALN